MHTPSRAARNRDSIGDDYTGGTGDKLGTGAFKELKHTSLSPRIHEIESQIKKRSLRPQVKTTEDV